MSQLGASGEDAAIHADVAVVGYGPVGMTLASLLGRRGHRVVVLERYPGLYNLPRAGVFDGETMRTWAVLGVAEQLLPKMRQPSSYGFQNVAGQMLLEFDCTEIGPSGWADWYGFYQPDLEDALDRACRSLQGVEVRHSSPVTGVAESPDVVDLAVAGPDGPARLTTRYVVGCDGGNSFVRAAMGVEQDDYGFGEAWMVCDFRLRREVALPSARQVCDPEQPTAIVSLGPTHHRLSFMQSSERDFPTESRPDRVWARAARYLGPEDAELIRVGTYTFRSLVAQSWRVGRVLLAGDAAHQMPPFLGQGMCSGIRDAQNLAFKLDLVLRGRADADLLDTYQAEREPHVRSVIERGIELGRIQTLRDPAAAAERDRRLLAQRAAGHRPAPIRLPGLTCGFLARGSGPGRGELSVNGVVDDGTGRRRLDELVGDGFRLLATASVVRELERDGTTARLRAVGIPVVGIGPEPGAGRVADVEGSYQRWFAERQCAAVLVRPDFYVYGTAADTAAARLLVGKLIDAIGTEGLYELPARGQLVETT